MITMSIQKKKAIFKRKFGPPLSHSYMSTRPTTESNTEPWLVTPPEMTIPIDMYHIYSFHS